jgi:hypothetical protein
MKKSAKKRKSPSSVKTRLTDKTKTEKSKLTDKPNIDSGENLPGYPYYPVTDDIMNAHEEVLAVDIENTEHPIETKAADDEYNIFEDETDDVQMMPGTIADVTPEELNNLGDENLSMDMGDDEELKHRVYPVDLEGTDLIVPGAELDDANEDIGEEDEENNLYSQSDN